LVNQIKIDDKVLIDKASAQERMKSLSQAEILKSHRMYEFISKANECMLISKTPEELFKGICDIAVSFEDILFCWIGTSDKNTEKLCLSVGRARSLDI